MVNVNLELLLQPWPQARPALRLVSVGRANTSMEKQSLIRSSVWSCANKKQVTHTHEITRDYWLINSILLVKYANLRRCSHKIYNDISLTYLKYHMNSFCLR